MTETERDILENLFEFKSVFGWKNIFLYNEENTVIGISFNLLKVSAPIITFISENVSIFELLEGAKKNNAVIICDKNLISKFLTFGNELKFIPKNCFEDIGEIYLRVFQKSKLGMTKLKFWNFFVGNIIKKIYLWKLKNFSK